MTSFETIYDRFYGKITDDMYLEWTVEDTAADMKNILLDALPGFEFPRFSLFNYNVETNTFAEDLTSEEIDIIANLMVLTWLNRQITTIELVRMKYTGSDFKLTSQANHLSKLILLKEQLRQNTNHLQRLYKRRKLNPDGTVSSNWASFSEESAT